MRDGAPQGHLLAALCERGDVGIAPYEMTCRAGPMCPAAKDAFSPARHANPALQGARVLGGQSRPPLQTGRRTPRAFVPLRSTAGRRPLRREALSLRGAKRRGNPFSPCLPLRGRWQRQALTEGEAFLSPSRLRRQPPPRGSLAARRCRARWRRGDVDIAPYEMTCRAGPMCPAAKDTFFPAGHAGPALRGARGLGGQSRPPLQVGRRTPVRAYSHVRSHNCPRLGRSSGRPA